MESLVVIATLLLSLIPQGVVRIPGPGGTSTPGNHIAVQNSCGVRSTVGVTSETVALNGASCNSSGFTPTSGDVEIIYAFFVSTQGSPSCAGTDSAGNTWATTAVGSTNNREMVCMSLLTHTSNATEVVSFTSSAVALFTVELSGAQNVLDGSSCSGTDVNNICFGVISSSSTWTLFSYATSNANDIVIGFDGSNGTSVTWTQVAPYTLLNTWSGSATANASAEYQIVTSTGTYAPKVNLSASTAGLGATLVVKSQ